MLIELFSSEYLITIICFPLEYCVVYYWGVYHKTFRTILERKGGSGTQGIRTGRIIKSLKG